VIRKENVKGKEKKKRGRKRKKSKKFCKTGCIKDFIAFINYKEVDVKNIENSSFQQVPYSSRCTYYNIWLVPAEYIL
jgi:hypothetical protein